MARPDEESSNTLFDDLEDWNEVLKNNQNRVSSALRGPRL